MASVNTWILEESIRHQADLAGYSNTVVRRIIAVLNRSDARLYVQLTAALERMDSVSFTPERLESLLVSVRNLNRAAYTAVGDTLCAELQDFVGYESAYQHMMLVSALPVRVHVGAVSASQVYAAALSWPFQGVFLKGVLDDMEAGRAKKIRHVVAQGFTERRTTAQVVHDLRGTQAKGYSDGLMEAPRREVEAVARTALGHMAGFVQDRTTQANAHWIKAIRWSRHLDLRTSEICQIRDGMLYGPTEHEPMGHTLPWLGGPGRAHWNCRSAQIYVLKSMAELGIKVPDVLMRDGTRASMDGQVPEDMTYREWITKQSPERQAKVLGPERARLMRDGKLSLQAMYSNKGVYKTLDELRESDAQAFKRAGL